MTLTEFKRLPERGTHHPDTINSIIDSALVGHVGFLRAGHPAVIPTLVVRRGDQVYIHGSPASALIRAGKAGAGICLTVTLIDGLVLARSAFHHSANYQSAVVYGRGRWVEAEEKVEVFEALVEKIVPGRFPHLRPMTRKEVAGTGVVALGLDHATAKIRTGPPADEDADYDLAIWAGVVPIETGFGAPVPDPRNQPGLSVPDHVIGLEP
jgi:hypothetical protein